MWKPSERLMDTIRHYASFPATGVSLRQMVQFGDRPSTGMKYEPIGHCRESISNSHLGTLFRASQFLSEELPIRLAHRVQDLGELPDGLSEMPSIKKVQDWYAQSFEVCDSPIGNRSRFHILTRIPGNHRSSSPHSDSRSESTPIATRPYERRPFKNPLRNNSKSQRT